jgi:hypothetical protein
VVTETARAINDDLSINDALPALGNLLNTPLSQMKRCCGALSMQTSGQAMKRRCKTW